MSVFLGIYAPITSATPNILCVYKRLETVQVNIRFRAPKKQCTFAQFVHLLVWSINELWFRRELWTSYGQLELFYALGFFGHVRFEGNGQVKLRKFSRFLDANWVAGSLWFSLSISPSSRISWNHVSESTLLLVPVPWYSVCPETSIAPNVVHPVSEGEVIVLTTSLKRVEDVGACIGYI